MASPPAATTNTATNIGVDSATLNATVNPNGTETTVYFQWGTTASYGNTTSSQSIGNGTSAIPLSVNISSLSPNTTYHYRVVASNAGGTTYGNDVSFTTTGEPIASPSGLMATAISSSIIDLSWTDNAGNEIGFKIERKTGLSGTYLQIASSGANITAYSDTGLTAGTTYYYRVRAYNSNGDSAYSNEANAVTMASPPTTTTNAATNIGFDSAALNALVNPNGTETTVSFQWGATASYGNTSPSQSIGSGISDVSVTANLTGLSSGATYHYRVVATNPGGTSYGEDSSFTTNNTTMPVITGGIIDSSTGSALSNVSIIIVDSLNQTYTTMTDSSGAYSISGITPGSFTATFMKTGYAEQILNGIVTSGQTLTLDVQLTPYALSFEIIKPTNAYNPGGWVNPFNGFDNDENTYSYKNTPNSSPSISFGGSSSNNAVNAWQSKSMYWYSALLYITFERLSSVNDLIEIVITDQNGNVKHTILSTISEIWPKKEFVQKLNMSDWGDGFNDIANLRVRVNGLRVQSSDNSESRVYDVRIEGNTSPSVKDYTRGLYSILPNNDNNLTTNYTPAEIINVDLDDESRVSQESSATQNLIHQFKRKTPSHNMTLTWNGQINKAGVEAYAQSFKPNTLGNITAVRIFFKKVGTPNGSLRVRIKSELGGNVITESNVIAETSLVLSGSWKTFTFINPALVTAGNTYYIEIWRNKADALNYPQVILKDCSSFANLDNFHWWRSNGSWATGLQGPILFETDINNTLDVSTGSCYSFVTPGRNITGLDWGNIYLEIYNRTTSSWVQLDTDLYDGSSTDINLLGTVSSDDYFDQNGWISARVYTTASNNDMIYLATDLINYTVTPVPPFLTGTVTDLSTGLPLPNVAITVTDFLNSVYTTTSNADGTYSLSGLSPGNFTAIFEKSGYSNQTVNDTLIMGETKTLNVQLIPIPPLTIAITSPQNGAEFTSSPVTVTGNVSNNANVAVNDVQASVSNNSFSVSVSLVAGQNTIIAAAADQYGQTTSHSINVTLLPAGLTGTVADIATGLPLTDATVTVTDSSNTYSTVTDTNGIYTLSLLTYGSFSAVFEHIDYVDKTEIGSLIAGQTLTLNVQMTPKIDAWEISAEPSEINFIRSPFTDQSLVFTVENTGSGTLIIQSVSNPSNPFSIIFNDCSGRSLPATALCSVEVKFAPSSEGMFTDSIIIRSNDGDNTALAVNLIGISEPSYYNQFLLPDTGQSGDITRNPMSYTVNIDDTVRDNNTKLIWQQQDDGSARSWLDAVSYCDGLTLGGYTDWRLPTGLELITLVHYGQYQPSIDSAVFPNTQSANYWTSQYKSGSEVFFVNFSSGEANYSDNSNTNYVRCVRGRQLPGPGAIAVLNGSGPMTDLSTGLMWGGFLQVPQSYIEEMEGIGLCDTTLYGGYTDWRDPTIKELAGFYINYNTCDYDINYPAEATWSTTADMHDPSQAFAFKSCGDMVTSYNKSTENYIRCVRGGYSGVLDIGRTISVNPVGLNFGSVAVDASAILTITVTNTGTGDLNIGSLTSPSAPFSIIYNGCSGNTLSGPATCTITVEFAPVSNGTFTSFVAINSDDADNPEIIVPMNGTTLFSTQTGTVTDSSTGMPLSSAAVSVTDSLNIIQTALTDINGTYTITGLTPGALSGSITKDDYSAYNFTSTISEGQTITINAALSPIPPTITNIAVNNITADSATITWTTDQQADSLVEFGSTTAYGSSAANASMTTSHSMTLTNLTPGTLYHFKITSTNAYDISSSSGDNSFTTSTPPVSVTTIGEYGNVTVMEITGNYDAKNPDGSINTVPRQEVAKEFLRLHSDQYDFMVIFSNFDFAMPEAEARAFYSEVKNNTQGIGKLLFNNSDLYGSSKLQGTIDMGNISNVISNPVDPLFDDTISILAHEQMHRWGASIKFRDTYGNDSTALQGKDGTHWSFLLDSEASVLYGNDWMDNGEGTFTSTGGGKYYSPLDLYLAGFYDSTQVPQMLLIDNSLIDATRLPEVGAMITGTSKYVTIDNIIAAEGSRIPGVSTSQKSFKTAFILITRPGTFNNNVLLGIETIRNAWAGRFTELTHGKGTIMDVTPSITLAIGSPSNGATITKPYITVKGAVINNTGNETGVTVNGIVATVYGTQFIAENVPLTDGSNNITVTATDTAGNTATTSTTVNALTTGGYIKLSSNINSGIIPLEVTLRIDGSFSITNSNLNITGPVQPIILSSSADEYSVKFAAEGVYFVTASATDSLGYVYQDTITIMVLNKTQLDTLLKGKWEGMKAVLGNQDIGTALNYYTERSRSHYNQVFTDIYTYLPQFVQEMQDIQLIYSTDGMAKYRIRKNEIYRGQAYTITYYIYFVVERDGIWRIKIF